VVKLHNTVFVEIAVLAKQSDAVTVNVNYILFEISNNDLYNLSCSK